jgi:hypothetical protein
MTGAVYRSCQTQVARKIFLDLQSRDGNLGLIPEAKDRILGKLMGRLNKGPGICPNSNTSVFIRLVKGTRKKTGIDVTNTGTEQVERVVCITHFM